MKLASSGFKSPTVVERPIVRSRRQRDRVASIERANQSVARVARFRVPSDVPKTGGVKNLAYKTLLTETDWAALDYTEEEKEKIEILMGAEAIEKLLNNINLEDEAKYLRGLIPTLKNTGPDYSKN